jgi:F-type H+-transporting ATPase subunit alpha
MQAFSQFASDLDPETQKILSRGERMFEMLKQGVNSPIAFHKQAVLTYAGIKNYFDSLEVSQVKAFEEALYDKLDTTHKELSDKIIADKKLTEEIEAGIKVVIEETVAEFAS